MGPLVNSGRTSIKPCRDVIAIIKVVIVKLYINTNLYKEFMTLKAFFWSDISSGDMVKYVSIPKKLGGMI